MTKREYAEYEKTVAEFFEVEGIENLSTGMFQCPDCLEKFDDSGKCPECNADRECLEEASFSWFPCDCCGRREGGDREYASGYCPSDKSIKEYNICVDCAYYAAYGRLYDQTMWDIEHDTGEND